MTVVEVVKINAKKGKVCTDTGYTFPLYNSEISGFGISEGVIISPEKLDVIRKHLFSRVKNRIMYLLEKSDKTSHMVKEKLYIAGYPEDIVENAVSCMTEYGYINDRRYAVNYIESMLNGHSISKRDLINRLRIRGIDKEVIENIISEYEFDDSSRIFTLMAKKNITPEIFRSMDIKDKKRLYNFLLRKGFDYGTINSFAGG